MCSGWIKFCKYSKLTHQLRLQPLVMGKMMSLNSGPDPVKGSSKTPQTEKRRPGVRRKYRAKTKIRLSKSW